MELYSTPELELLLMALRNRSTSNTVKVKAQLPNVSKQRVHIKSNNDRQYQPGVTAYPNSVIAGNFIRGNNNSTKRRDIPKYPNTSFQITNNFIQTSYGGMGNMNQTQIMNKTGYNGLVYDDKELVNQTNTSRANKKYKITNFHPPAPANGNMNTIYLRKQNKNLFNIYKTKTQSKQGQRNMSPSSPRNKSNSPKMIVPTNQLFSKQYVDQANRSNVPQQRRVVVNNARGGNYSPRDADVEYPGILNNTFNIAGNGKMNAREWIK